MKKLSKQAEKKTNGGKTALKSCTKKATGVVGIAVSSNIAGKVQKKPVAKAKIGTLKPLPKKK